ncbi:MAG: crossover junction endodeoxyribonuclease RuvC [Thermoflavifilum sp.]|uniref:crossover junction endodeoxyribonuclease RuvC n=1 Tax=Thermoflavifilum sp. TaxID=1968839 RepID=UPI0018A64640|nr:crossover junction endodeoxyribonuclease RuvC [Thermoflavifilum sp.]QOR75103.1 MAG: crossover junction endodeoxyribonuclease RuvC [Thermoflavifilum sp.]
MLKRLTILGIDPGTVIMGYSVIGCQTGRVDVLEMGVLKLSRHKDHYERLQSIYQKVTQLIDHFPLSDLAIESPFQGKNIQSMLKLGRAQGVAIVCAKQAGLQVTEYSPKKVKQAVTGNGNAGKQQVWLMLQRQLQLPGQPEYYDATDALAVALCHYYNLQQPLPDTGSTKKAWKQFLAQHPERVVN